MISRKAVSAFAGALLAVAFVPAVFAQRSVRFKGGDEDIRHVLLISIDGMHAVDYENCVTSHTCPNLAALGKTGVNYTRTLAAFAPNFSPRRSDATHAAKSACVASLVGGPRDFSPALWSVNLGLSEACSWLKHSSGSIHRLFCIQGPNIFADDYLS